MKAFLHKGRIRVTPVPKTNSYMLIVWLKKALTENNKPYVYADIEPGKKYYDLPCDIENINGVVINLK